MAVTSTYSVRLTPEDRKRLKAVAEKTGVNEGTLTRESLMATVRFVEENGYITFPLRIVSIEQFNKVFGPEKKN